MDSNTVHVLTKINELLVRNGLPVTGVNAKLVEPISSRALGIEQGDLRKHLSFEFDDEIDPTVKKRIDTVLFKALSLPTSAEDLGLDARTLGIERIELLNAEHVNPDALGPDQTIQSLEVPLDSAKDCKRVIGQLDRALETAPRSRVAAR